MKITLIERTWHWASFTSTEIYRRTLELKIWTGLPDDLMQPKFEGGQMKMWTRLLPHEEESRRGNAIKFSLFYTTLKGAGAVFTFLRPSLLAVAFWVYFILFI